MKAKALIAVASMTAWQCAWAEPVFMAQAASVLKAKQAEAGVGGHFGYQSSEIIGNAGTTYKNRVWQFPVFARYGMSDDVQAQLILPIVRAVDSSEGLTSTRYSDTGIGNLTLGAKWNFLKGMVPLAAALDVDFPTANASHNAGALGERYNTQLQQGFNEHLQLVADSPVMHDMMSLHASVGYMNTATYTTSTRARFNPSDLFTFGASVDMSLKRCLEGLSVAAEVVGNSGLTHARTNSTVAGNDLGTVIEVGPSLRYQHNALRTYAGFLVDEGKATFRAYNYRVAFGASLLWGGH